MTEKAKLEALVRAMDSFISGVDPTRYAVTRQQIGEGALYVFHSSHDGAKLGQIAAHAGPEWSEPAYLERMTSRDVETLFQQYGAVKDWPEEERQRAQDFKSLCRRVNAHLDLYLGKGMWAGVWEHVKQGPIPPAGDNTEGKPTTPRGKRGKRSRYSQAERDEAVKAWESLSKEDTAQNLKDFLVDKFGDGDDWVPFVAKSTFYDWRRKFYQRNPGWKPNNP